MATKSKRSSSHSSSKGGRSATSRGGSSSDSRRASSSRSDDSYGRSMQDRDSSYRINRSDRGDRDIDDSRRQSRNEGYYGGDERGSTRFSGRDEYRDMSSRRGYDDRYDRGQQYSGQNYDQDRSQFNRPSRSNYGQFEGDYRDESRRGSDGQRGYRDMDEDYNSDERRMGSRDYRDYGQRESRDWQDSDDTDAYQEALRSGSHDEDLDEEDDLSSRRSSRRGSRSGQNARH